MQLVNIPFLAAWLMLYLASDVWMVFFALALTGITGGLLEAPVSIHYIMYNRSQFARIRSSRLLIKHGPIK